MKLRLSIAAATVAAATGAGLVAAQGLGDERVLDFHVDHRQIASGEIDAATLIEAGRLLFVSKFTSLDGAGRPAATGAALPTRRDPEGAFGFLRTNGPDSTSCVSCHNDPEPGGGGDFVANVFALAQERGEHMMSINADSINERGTTEMHGGGLIELLAREMTAELLELRATAIASASRTRAPARAVLVTKGVTFGALMALPDGQVDTSEVEGVGADLVIRPWSQKGTNISLREFTIGAMNHHHGMQAEERYGITQTGTRDFDQDLVRDELTTGDITAIVAFQAVLPPPRQIMPQNPEVAAAVVRGEAVFNEIGCTSCHVSEMVLNNVVFSEPGPINGGGTLTAGAVPGPARIDLSTMPWFADMERTPDGGVIVRAFTDLKLHKIADEDTPHFGNEQLRQSFRLQPLPGPELARARQRMRGAFSQDFVPTDVFLTRRLWAVGNTGPYGHRADLTTLNEAILAHGGEGRAARLGYESLGQYDRAAVIEFLRSWQIVPSPPLPADPEVRQRLVDLWRLATITQ